MSGNLEPDSRTVAVLLYGATSVLIALMFNVLWSYASARNLVREGPMRDQMNLVARGFRLGPLVYLAATLVAFINPGRIPGRPTL